MNMMGVTNQRNVRSEVAFFLDDFWCAVKQITELFSHFLIPQMHFHKHALYKIDS